MPHAPAIALSAAAPGVAWLTLDKQATRNALDWEALERLEELVRQAESDRELGVLVIRSALERVFVAGADIGVVQALTPADGARFAAAGQGLMERLEGSRLVTIAAVGGFALGGGFELALACDLVVASEAAVFGLPETGIGLVPGFGGTQRLTRAVSPQRAREVVLAGRRRPPPRRTTGAS